MLNKLMKYEIKATARIFIPLYIALIVLSFVNKIFIATPSTSIRGILSITSALSIFAYISLIIGIQVITFVVQVQRFYKNLLGDEGYLMFTVPVKPWQLITSKLIISTLWLILSSLISVLSVFIIMPLNAFKDIMNGFSQAISEVLRLFGASTILFGSEFLVICILGTLLSTLVIYAAIALGHLAYKRKILTSFGMFLVISTVLQFIMLIYIVALEKSIFRNIANFTLFAQAQSVLLCILIYLIVCVVGLFILTKYILDKKLNLE